MIHIHTIEKNQRMKHLLSIFVPFLHLFQEWWKWCRNDVEMDNKCFILQFFLLCIYVSLFLNFPICLNILIPVLGNYIFLIFCMLSNLVNKRRTISSIGLFMVAIFGSFLAHFQLHFQTIFQKWTRKWDWEWTENDHFCKNGTLPLLLQKCSFSLSFWHLIFLIISNSAPFAGTNIINDDPASHLSPALQFHCHVLSVSVAMPMPTPMLARAASGCGLWTIHFRSNIWVIHEPNLSFGL